jgi:hypothetical protein
MSENEGRGGPGGEKMRNEEDEDMKREKKLMYGIMNEGGGG